MAGANDWDFGGCVMDAWGPMLKLDERRRGQSQEGRLADTSYKSGSHCLSPLQSPRSAGSSPLTPRSRWEGHQQSSTSLASTLTGSVRTSASLFTTAGSQFKLPTASARPARSAPGKSMMVDLAFSLSSTPRRGGAAIWKLEAEPPPDAPWELHKDEAMWVALTGLRRKVERQRRLQLLPARKAPAVPKVPPSPKPAQKEKAQTTGDDPALELPVSRRRQARVMRPESQSEGSEPAPQKAEEEKRPAAKTFMVAATAIQRIVRGMQIRRRRSTEEEEIAARVQETARRLSDSCLKAPWRPGAELPMTTTDGLWELLKGGHISGQIFAIDLLGLFSDCKKSGLDLELSNAVLGNFSGIQSHREPMEVHPRQVATLIDALNKNPRMELVREDLCDMVALVPDPFGEALHGYEDLGIENTTRMGLSVFRKTLQIISLLMAIEECYIVSHIVWFMTGEFEVSKDMGQHIYRQMGLKAPNPVRLSYQDFLNLCIAFRVQMPSGRNVFQGDSVSGIFNRAILNIPKIFERRRFRKMHQREDDECFDKHEKRKQVAGWTEWSILLQELFAAIPAGAIPNPLQMCLAGPQFTHSMPLS